MLINKNLTIKHLRIARIDTIVGAIFCQVVTVAILIAAATAFAKGGGSLQLNNIPQIATAFTSVLGKTVGNIIFSVGMISGALVATVVVSLSAVWTIGEIAGLRHNIEHNPTKAPLFYLLSVAALVFGGILVVISKNLVDLPIAIGVLNTMLLPFMFAFLYFLASK